MFTSVSRVAFISLVLLHQCTCGSALGQRFLPFTPFSFGFPDDKSSTTTAAPAADKDKQAGKSTAKCSGGEFSCSKEAKPGWCAEQIKRCYPKQEDNCTPKCTWTCEKRECDEVCAPKCNAAICSTRCKGFNTDTCRMKCQQPACKVICPKHGCPKGDCTACRTECGKPVCQMECQKQEQPCHQVCAQPLCNWECSKPKVCPLPDCKLTCEKPACAKQMHVVQALPPLEPGETEVSTSLSSNFSAGNQSGSSLLRLRSSVRMQAKTMRVNITSMGLDRKMQTREVNLQVAPMTAQEEQHGSSWIIAATTQDGKTSQTEASCTDGTFKCTGDASWCEEQSKQLSCASTSSLAAQTAPGPASFHAFTPEASPVVTNTVPTAQAAVTTYQENTAPAQTSTYVAEVATPSSDQPTSNAADDEDQSQGTQDAAGSLSMDSWDGADAAKAADALQHAEDGSGEDE